jgi:hypothetical protein
MFRLEVKERAKVASKATEIKAMDSEHIDESTVNADFATLQSYIAGRRRVNASSDPLRFDHARADINIANWMSYLPADCVQAMVRLGWHKSA